MNKIIKTKSDKAEIDNLMKTASKYFPDIDNAKLKDICRQIQEKGCSYVATANTIFEQLNYDADRFRKEFGFEMYLPNGKLNHDQLILDLWCFMNSNIAISYNQTVKKTYNSYIDAVYALFGKQMNKDQAVIELLLNQGTGGYNAVGSPDGSVDIIKLTGEVVSEVGTPSSIAKKLLGKDYDIQTEEELIQVLKNNGFNIPSIACKNPGKKLYNHNHYTGAPGTGSFKPDTYINAYFESKDISLSSKSFEINYEQLNDFSKNGYTIFVNMAENSQLWDGTSWGHIQLNEDDDNKSGHAVTLTGITPDGNIEVSSWGKKYLIKK